MRRFWIVPLLLAIAGCKGPEENPPKAAFGDAGRGVALIADAGCGSCHIIPGLRWARGLVGPPLDHVGRRIYIAGLLRNTPENMVAWLRFPQRIVPGNAMPDMGLNDEEARDIAAYLFSIE